MTDLEQAIETLERGLVTPRRTLRQRMAAHKVPGFSIALVDGGELAWAKGYGVLEAGGDRAVTTESFFQAESDRKGMQTFIFVKMIVLAAVNNIKSGSPEEYGKPESPYAGRRHCVCGRHPCAQRCQAEAEPEKEVA